jgi:hypothetical protein
VYLVCRQQLQQQQQGTLAGRGRRPFDLDSMQPQRVSAVLTVVRSAGDSVSFRRALDFASDVGGRSHMDAEMDEAQTQTQTQTQAQRKAWPGGLDPVLMKHATRAQGGCKGTGKAKAKAKGKGKGSMERAASASASNDDDTVTNRKVVEAVFELLLSRAPTTTTAMRLGKVCTELENQGVRVSNSKIKNALAENSKPGLTIVNNTIHLVVD